MIVAVAGWESGYFTDLGYYYKFKRGINTPPKDKRAQAK